MAEAISEWLDDLGEDDTCTVTMESGAVFTAPAPDCAVEGPDAMLVGSAVLAINRIESVA